MLNPKLETLNSKQTQIFKAQNSRGYDLEERTYIFAKSVIAYVNSLPKSTTGIEIGKQLTRAAGSIGANYIEAEESLSKKDFFMRIKISRKEAKESRYWLMLSEPLDNDSNVKLSLIDEATQLMKIFGAIVGKIR
jgi:four helix bundle protein